VYRRSIWSELKLLCRSGAGLEALAPDISRLLRELIGADAVAVFWLDTNGMPEGFFHEDSPLSTRELFANEFERLFVGESEINVTALAKNEGKSIGYLLNPDPSYYHSNTYNLLVRPSGHHHALDIRVDVQGRTRAVILLFRTRGTPFDKESIILLERAESYLTQIFALKEDTSIWRTDSDEKACFLVRHHDCCVVMCSENTNVLLGRLNLVGAGGRLTNMPNDSPRFIRELCEKARLNNNCQSPYISTRAVPGGLLKITVVAMHTPQNIDYFSDSHLLVTLEFMRPSSLVAVQRVLALDISPLQREIALMAGLGQARSMCTESLGTSNESLKKHLRVVYAAAGVRNWDELVVALSR
jgi:hypothetical protein